MSIMAADNDHNLDCDLALECWAARMIARATVVFSGELDLHDAVDRSWQAAVDAGLVDEFGADEIQAAMALAFESARC
jgi:hypothetical protein